MLLDHFFEIALDHFDDALPFVLYRKPDTTVLKGIFQNNDTVHTSETLTESGFVFAPFNSEESTILIPIEDSYQFETIVLSGKKERTHFKEDRHSIEAKPFYIKLISKAIKAISDNEFQKVVLSRKETKNLSQANPIELFKRLLEAYPMAFTYCWYHPKIGLWLGATPETLISTTGNRFATMALAGTQIDQGDNNTIWQDKEAEEQQLVTNFIVENLKPLVENLTVGTPETVKAGNLLHLKTKISGTLNSNLKGIINVLHPTPAVCGLPKDIAKQFILEHENYAREFYTGFLGELNIKERLARNTNRRNVENNAYAFVKTVSNLFVNLRCMQLTDANASIYVGGGITKGSNSESEWEETVNKTQTMKKVLF